MSRSKSSSRWLKEHFDDPYVKQSKTDGYRSRASYKLLEIDNKDHLLKPGQIVLDLGSAPGGWSQVAAKRVGNTGLVIASDILDMDFIPGVFFVKGDFTETHVSESILKALKGNKADLVISDMAPNMSGAASSDIPRSMYLVALALEMAAMVLKPGGHFVTKVFQGEGFENLLKQMRNNYQKVYSRKPDSSRSRSREVYQVGFGFKG